MATKCNSAHDTVRLATSLSYPTECLLKLYELLSYHLLLFLFSYTVGSSSSNRKREYHQEVDGVKQDLQRVIDQQHAEMERLKSEKAAVDASYELLKRDHEKISNENRILKRAVTIQQERQNLAASEIEAARRYGQEADQKSNRLEQMNLTLQYHLQAQQTPSNDFMNFNQRPPDVF
jgi:hypothetical protein